MIPTPTLRCGALNEFSLEEQNAHFGLSRDKAVHHIDTLYYTISIDENDPLGLAEDSTNGKKQDAFVKDIRSEREKLRANPNGEYEFCGLTVKLIRFATYDLCVSEPDNFDIFISSYRIGDTTPRIVVQIRTRMLVLLGVQEAVRQTLAKVNEMLSKYRLHAVRVDENRIDYAYHTNLIQNPALFFSDEQLLKHAKTRLKRYRKDGYLDTELTIDYLSLGSRKSDDVFVRIYLKDQEVIEQAYKPFFIEKWFQDGLISAYDKFVFAEAYNMHCYRSGLLVGRIKWYLQHGKSEEKKTELRDLLKKCHVDSDNNAWIEKKLKGFLPPTTKIMNIEFQTKRRFYKYFDKEIEAFDKYKHDAALYGQLTDRLFKVIHMRSAFLDYLTRYGGTLSFVYNRNVELKKFDVNGQYMSWWRVIRRVKVSDAPRYTGLVRSSTRSLDREKTLRRNMSDLASFSIISSGTAPRPLADDAADLLCAFVNDNDMHASDLEMLFVNKTTGAAVDPRSEKYDMIRRRKARKLKPMLKL